MHKGMVKAIAAIGILQVLTIVVQIVRAKLVAVVLGPAGLGVVGLIDQLVIAVGFITSLSLPTVVLRVLPRVYGEPAFGRLYIAFLKGVIVASVLGSAALVAALATRPSAFGEVAATYVWEFGIALAGVPLFAVGLLLPNVLAASMRPVGAAGLSFSITAVGALAAAVGLLWGGLRDIYVAQFIGTAMLLALALVYFKLKLHLPFYDRSASLVREIRERPDIIPNAGAVYASLVASAVALLVVRYVTVHSLGAEAGGQLQAILSMVLGVGAVMVAMASRYIGPLLNRPSSLEEKFVLFDLFRRRQLMMLIAVAVPLVLLAKLALTIMFSSKFTAAAPWLPAFLVWQLIVIQTNVQLQLLFALDELWIVTVKAVAGCVVSALLCVALIPRFGMTGGATAMIAGALVTLWIGSERLRRNGYVVSRSSLLLGGYAAAVLLAAPYAMQSALWNSIPLKIAVCILLVGGLWPFLEVDEKAMFKRLFGRFLLRRPAG